MLAWAAVILTVLGVLIYALSEPAMALLNLAELVGVVLLFALVCAAEAFN
ncbi:hypothetical protein [Microvirga flavescens]|nr:hypothetical protein [Microvirga flavescens]